MSDATPNPPPRPRVLAVVAHPDDETLGAGGTLAWWAQRGDVVLVTATRGERGEVLGPRAAELAADPEGLARYRSSELAAAVSALGISRQVFLDELADGVRYVDSGMTWADESHTRAIPAPDSGPDAFSRADVDVAAVPLAVLIDQFKPHVVLTEEPGGGYGHPDHVQAHRVATRAAELASAAPLVAWFARSESEERAALDWLAQVRGAPTTSTTGAVLRRRSPDGPLASMVAPTVDISLDVRPHLPAVAAAMRAHATQVQQVQLVDATDAGGWYALSDGVLSPIPVRVGLRAAHGQDPVALRYLVAQTDRYFGQGGYVEPRWYRVVAMLCAVLLGLLLASVGTAFHRSDAPVGVVVALTAVAAGGFLARTVAAGRGALLYALTVAVVVFSMTYLRPGDDLLVTNEPISMIWMLGALIASGLVALAPARWFREDEPR
ncbi:MAG: PIG-L family deacetylase [Beutenbergiaceae bacterium]